MGPGSSEPELCISSSVAHAIATSDEVGRACQQAPALSAWRPGPEEITFSMIISTSSGGSGGEQSLLYWSMQPGGQAEAGVPAGGTEQLHKAAALVPCSL